MEPPKPPQEKTWSVSFTVGSQGPDGAPSALFSWIGRLRVIDALFLLLALAILVLEPLAFMAYFKDRLSAAAETCRSEAREMAVQPAPASGYRGDPGPPPENRDLITPLNARDPSNLIMSLPSYPPPAADTPPPPAPKDEVWDRVVGAAKGGAVQKAKRVHPPTKEP